MLFGCVLRFGLFVIFGLISEMVCSIANRIVIWDSEVCVLSVWATFDLLYVNNIWSYPVYLVEISL